MLLATEELPDIATLKHIIKDNSDDLEELLVALSHMVEIHASSLP